MVRFLFTQEVLQTIENQRQQQHMAINKMMNDYLRKQESNQSRDLALLETNYDWNPYTGKYEFNPEKAKENFAYKKATFNNNEEEKNYWKKKYLKLVGKDEEEQTTKR